MDHIKYIRLREHYKYKLAENYVHHQCGIYGHVDHDFFRLEGDSLIVRAGYAWDGPSGPTIDTRTFMRASLVHDVFCQMIRDGLLKISARRKADQLLYAICIDDGMHPIRAKWVYLGVRLYGSFFKTRPYPPRKIVIAPVRRRGV